MLKIVSTTWYIYIYIIYVNRNMYNLKYKMHSYQKSQTKKSNRSFFFEED